MIIGTLGRWNNLWINMSVMRIKVKFLIELVVKSVQVWSVFIVGPLGRIWTHVSEHGTSYGLHRKGLSRVMWLLVSLDEGVRSHTHRSAFECVDPSDRTRFNRMSQSVVSSLAPIECRSVHVSHSYVSYVGAYRWRVGTQPDADFTVVNWTLIRLQPALGMWIDGHQNVNVSFSTSSLVMQLQLKWNERVLRYHFYCLSRNWNYRQFEYWIGRMIMQLSLEPAWIWILMKCGFEVFNGNCR